MKRWFAGYPAPFIREIPDGRKKQQLIWGDFVTPIDEVSGDWVKVRSRREEGWMLRSDLQNEQLLEVNFVDVGQGDGAFIVTPDDKFILVDAGESDNMLRFLDWRFNLRRNPDRVISFNRAFITHPDQDHYGGFDQIFKSTQFEFNVVYHNGIVERPGRPNDSLGPRPVLGRRAYVTDIIGDTNALERLLSDQANIGKKEYPKLLKQALDSQRVEDFAAVSADDGIIATYGDENDLTIKVLAPVLETVTLPDADTETQALRWFGDPGKTKNGHSVVLRFVYRKVSVLLGGDLNIPAAEFLLNHYTGLDPNPQDEPERRTLVDNARLVFESDAAKACHHGSADFSTVYLQAVNPLVTVISSGDGEPHAHPRPDALGAFGKHGRDPRPLLFSTELARSTNENLKRPSELRSHLDKLIKAWMISGTQSEREKAKLSIDRTLTQLERSVAVYGLINLRTDGKKMILAQKLEQPRGGGGEWDVHCFEPDDTGSLHYVPKN